MVGDDGCVGLLRIANKKKQNFKNGNKIVQKGKVLRHMKTVTKCLNLNYDVKIHNKIKEWFNKYYALSLDEFEIDESFFCGKQIRKKLQILRVNIFVGKTTYTYFFLL